MKQKFSEGADQKKELALRQERKRLDMLDTLKEYGGPFTAADEVSLYMMKEDFDEKSK